MSEPPPFGGNIFIADKSAWKFARHPLAATEWTRALFQGQLAVTPIVNREILFSARDSAEFIALEEELGTFRLVPMSQGICDAAIGAMRELAECGPPLNHRVNPPDALVAAAAAERGWGVLHYDRHFERLAEVLNFESRWIVPPGTIPGEATGTA